MGNSGVFGARGTLGERFRDVSGYEGRYRIGNMGTVMSVVRGEGFVLEKVDKGRFVNLYRNGVAEKLLVSYLVARAWLPNPERRPFVVHKDGNPQNNAVGNLMWSESRDSGAVKKAAGGVVRWDADGCNPVGFETVSEAAMVCGCSRQGIMNCLAGRASTCGGWIWTRK